MADTVTEAMAEIRRIAREELEFEGGVEPSHDLLRDLHLDSLGLTVLAVGLENRFRVLLSEEDAQGVRTVEDLARLVAARVAAMEQKSTPEAGAHP
ncbi:acyl carrier protein [Corallococcus llansteffanensis]|uniref:Acyl carrier protein n=1 Tax=Corallococcus llansteffanensis TaxID=2316731 RepID=A0A3A8NIK7_9BACT|nr:acyl carrier protein [Corallococcus llansteffanensis]RKH40985.1 acyl carrier protein [Corallococcus llansteffanensis]